MTDTLPEAYQPGPFEPDDAESVTVRGTGVGGPVDPPDQRKPVFASVVSSDRQRRPIVPATMRTKEQRRQLAGWAVRFGGHTVLYHLTRSPKYLAKATLWAPIGAGRTLWKAIHWGFDLEGAAIRQHAASKNDIDSYRQLSRQRDGRVAWRGWVLLGGAIALVVALCLLVFLASTLEQVVAGLVALPVLARLGRPLEKPILDRVTYGEQFRKLTADMVRKAILATGKVKDAGRIKFTREIVRDGPGYLAVVDLPDGVLGVDIIDERDRLAGGFVLPQDQVWPDVYRTDHPGRVHVWVADRPVSQMKQPRSPMLDGLVTDYFQPFPFGNDPRMRPVSWRLDERNSLFGGIPGSGKSMAARNVLLGAVLDPLVIPMISELKGSGDYDMFEKLCPRGLYVSGADDNSIARTMDIVEWIDLQCELRGPLIAKYARAGMNTVKKLNRAMAEHDERLRPVVAMFDEVQEFMASPYGIPKGKDPVNGAGTLMSSMKRARALGIHVILATQRFDKDSMPKAISSLVSNRAALAVPAQPETDMILGTSAYRTGARPTAFVPGPPPEGDSGWMVRAGFSPRFETVQATFIDDVQAAEICDRAMQLRGSTPTVDMEKRPDRDVLADVIKVFSHTNRPGMHWQQLAELLAGESPELYAGLTPEALSAQVRAEGVESVDVKSGGVTLKGCRWAAVEEAVKRRQIMR
jgi:S-DNA-T family DNA segregation ATPase FtsK/SpoIIIE